MKIQEFIYYLYEVNHKYGNLDVMIMDREMRTLSLDSGATVDIMPIGHGGAQRKVLVLRDFEVTKVVRDFLEKQQIATIQQKEAESNIINLFTRKKVIF